MATCCVVPTLFSGSCAGGRSLSFGLLMAAVWLVGQPVAMGDDSARSPVYYFDLTQLDQVDLRDAQQLRRAWDTLHLAASVQGIVNRRQATLFIRFQKSPDDFWFDYLHEKGHWLADRPIRPIQSVEELLNVFQDRLAGVVVYREEHRPASNVASTIAGVEDRVCLRYDAAADSVFSRVLATKLPFTGNMLKLYGEDGSAVFGDGKGKTIPGTGEPGVPSSGSAKCDAYLWALHRYGKDGGVSPKYLAYYIDTYWLAQAFKSSLSNSTLTNHDFFIANKAFFCDLSAWEDETPVDDPHQPVGADSRTLRAILRSTHDRNGGKISMMGGFVPWLWKYTNADGHSKKDAVASEWETCKNLSAYNVILDADALGYSGMTNASFYQHFPLKDRYPQNPRPTLGDLKKKGFVGDDGRVAPYAYTLFYMGDYDSAAWLIHEVPKLWSDPARGTIPCSWAFNPNLDRRCPHVLDYVRTHQTSLDWFVAGDCGAGYLNPGMLLSPRLDPEVPDGIDAWVEHNLASFRRYDLSITGFIIDGFAPEMGRRGFDAYEKFSPDGIIGQKMPPFGMHNTMPCIRMQIDRDGQPPEVGVQIAAAVGAELPQFSTIRTILKSPTWHKETIVHAQQAANGDKLRFVDPYTFFLLLKTHLQQSK